MLETICSHDWVVPKLRVLATRLVQAAYHPSGAIDHLWPASLRFLDGFLETLVSLHSRFTWSMEAPVFNDEGFQIYRKYQNRVHGDDLESLLGENYERFLCDSPLKKREIPGLPDPLFGMRLWYGTWHIHYRLDGILRAVSVIDILPNCISSVYLYYDPDHDAALSWGTVSALLEIGLVRRIAEVCSELRYYYLGYYLENCPKLAYKARFRPSELLDPITAQPASLRVLIGQACGTRLNAQLVLWYGFMTPLTKEPFAADVARLRVRIRELRFDDHPPRLPHIQVRLGHRVYTSPKRALEGPWTDVYDLELSLHEHLFYTLQIDVYDTRTLFAHSHKGRTEIRLKKLTEGRKPVSKWYELKDKVHCYANLSDLGVRDSVLGEHKVGQVLVETHYRLIDPKGEGREFLQTTNVAVPPKEIAELILPQRSASVPSLLPSMIKKLEEEEALDDRDETASIAGVTVPNGMESHTSLEDIRDKMDDLREVQSEIIASREINSLLKRISGWVFTNDDYSVVQNILNGMAGFGQGIVAGSFSLTIGFLLLQRFYRSLPVPFSNNIVLKKEDLEIPRIIYRYAYAAHGWACLYAFGKRNEIFSDAISADANHRAVIEYLQLAPQDMLVCDLDQHRLFRPNFYVALDRRLSAVVLSIRGTMSFRDTLTDLSYEYVAWHGGIAHSGILVAARWFMDNIGKQLTLFAEEYQMQRIYITGHSLGGATAALTTIMLTEELEATNSWPLTKSGQRIDIHCYSYGTPAVLSAELATKYTDLIDTFIVGDDIVPRLCYGTMIDLQVLMVYASEIAKASDLIGAKEGSALFQRLEACRRAIIDGRGVENMKLLIPGRIHHIMTIKAPAKQRYTVVDTCGPRRFLEMALRKNMLLDHLPSRYEQAFEEAYVTYLLHELEERQGPLLRGSSTIREKMKGVVDVVNEKTIVLQDGAVFPRHASSRPHPEDGGTDKSEIEDGDPSSTNNPYTDISSSAE